ncbi:dihydrolipoyllysine-residue acetyltransferase component of pyruvate dehydrogenase complex [bacterium BMS3Bbin02]|nr:dihydrolipoyllysine-residue acetyltransferase component of pyruvate dehydrogenase complex [bacterium BMS3Bbin02]
MPVTVTMPQLGETVTEGTILSWAKAPGDVVAEDEILLEISTDKVDTEVPSPAAGVIQEILVAEGETVEVGAPLAIISNPDEAVAPAAEMSAAETPVPAPETDASAPKTAATDSAAPVPAADSPAAQADSVKGSGDDSRRGNLSPIVRKLAAEHSINLDLVSGTGEGGRITRSDVMAFIEGTTPQPEPSIPETTTVTFEPAPDAPAAAAPSAAGPAPAIPAPAPTPAPPAPEPAPIPAAPVPVAPPPSAPTPAPPPPVVPAVAVPAPAQETTEVPIGRLRKRIAANMVAAKATAAHVWTVMEVDFERVERTRSAHKQEFKSREGYSLTYLPFISRATMDALMTFPVVNSAFHLDEGTQVFNTNVNLGIAVDMNEEGLVVVTVKNADSLRLKGLARDIRSKAIKARDGKLDPDDISGSTFTITNPGPFGSFMSAPIINVPNVAILSTDTVTKRATVVTLPDGSDSIAIHHIGMLGLTWDHRAFDGSTAVKFLGRIKNNLETWDWDQELS